MNFDYTIHGGDEHIRPVRVFDDGAKTYIQMPADLEHREAPVLLVLGKDEMTNYRVKDQTISWIASSIRRTSCSDQVRRRREWRSAVDTNSSSDYQPIEAPSGLDLHPEPQKAVRISRRAGVAIVSAQAARLHMICRPER